MMASPKSMPLWFADSFNVEVLSVSLLQRVLEKVLGQSGLMILDAVEMSQLSGTASTEAGEGITVTMLRTLE